MLRLRMVVMETRELVIRGGEVVSWYRGDTL